MKEVLFESLLGERSLDHILEMKEHLLNMNQSRLVFRRHILVKLPNSLKRHLAHQQLGFLLQGFGTSLLRELGR
jgi:hypothetical protein